MLASTVWFTGSVDADPIEGELILDDTALRLTLIGTDGISESICQVVEQRSGIGGLGARLRAGERVGVLSVDRRACRYAFVRSQVHIDAPDGSTWVLSFVAPGRRGRAADLVDVLLTRTVIRHWRRALLG